MLFPSTETRTTALRSTGSADASEIYEILLAGGRANLPMVERFWAPFVGRLSACFGVVRKDTERTVGVATLSNLMPAGHLRVEVSMLPEQPSDVRTDATALVTNFAFAMWRCRKVYFHQLEPEPDLGFGREYASMVRAEAVLKDFEFRGGRVWDVHVSAITREDWDSTGSDLLKQRI